MKPSLQRDRGEGGASLHQRVLQFALWKDGGESYSVTAVPPAFLPRTLRILRENLEEEAKIMKDVPGWKVWAFSESSSPGDLGCGCVQRHPHLCRNVPGKPH